MQDIELHMQGSLWIEKLDKLSNQVMTDEYIEKELSEEEKKANKLSGKKKSDSNLKSGKKNDKISTEEETLEEIKAISEEIPPGVSTEELLSMLFSAKKD